MRLVPGMADRSRDPAGGSPPPLRAAVIGAGYLGRFHAQKYAAIEDVALVAVVDRDAGRARTVAREVGADWETDFRTVLPQVDLVSVVTPTVSHHAVGRACLEAGVHVLVEKPFTLTLEEADELIELADRKGRVLQVGHLKRFHPAVMALVASGLLKTPRFIESQRFAPFKSRSLDVDVVLDLMIHDVDLILNFVGSDVVDVQAVGVPVLTGQVDMANARLRFANGCVANVSASRVARDSSRRIRIFQDDTFFSLDFIKNDIVTLRRGTGSMLLDGVAVPNIEETTIPIATHDTLEAEIRSFCGAVRGIHPPLVDGRDGRKALEVIEQIRSAIRAFTQSLDKRGVPDS